MAELRIETVMAELGTEVPGPSSPKVIEIIEETLERDIVADGDCFVVVKHLGFVGDRNNEITKFYAHFKFKVKKATLTENSRFFKAMFGPHFAEGNEGSIPVLEEVDGPSVEVIFQVLHGVNSETIFDISSARLWCVIYTCDQYEIDCKLFEDWFAGWYKRKIGDMSSCSHIEYSAGYDKPFYTGSERFCEADLLLFPSYTFRHAEAFAQVTQHLVETSIGPIEERNPLRGDHLSTPPRIVQQLNSYRGDVLTLLERAICSRATELSDTHPSRCQCPAIDQFLEELKRQHFLPFFELAAARDSLSMIIAKLSKFSYWRVFEPVCTKFQTEIRDIATKYCGHLTGLCLDCIAGPETEQDPNHTNRLPFNRWSRICKMQHSEITWYLSYCARDEKQRRVD